LAPKLLSLQYFFIKTNYDLENDVETILALTGRRIPHQKSNQNTHTDQPNSDSGGEFSRQSSSHGRMMGTYYIISRKNDKKNVPDCRARGIMPYFYTSVRHDDERLHT
jgi:hypothetical protein